MKFSNRKEAGKLLAKKLTSYLGENVIVYAIPRGGVVTGVEIAKYLDAPIDLLVTRKISHPYNPEYAIAAISESGQIVGNRYEMTTVDEDWLEEAVDRERKEIIRRRETYLPGITMLSPRNEIAIIVDDGVATGLTLRAAIKELKHLHPRKIVIAVPVLPRSTAAILTSEADELLALEIPTDNEFEGAVSSYYDSFDEVSDHEVIKLLSEYQKEWEEEYDEHEYGETDAKDFLC